VALTVDGKTMTRPLTVMMDPRVKMTPAELAQQFDLSFRVYQDLEALSPLMEAVDSLRNQLADRKKKTTDKPEAAAALADFEKKLAPIAGGDAPPRPGVPATAPMTLNTISGRLGQLFGVLQEVDAAPTASAVANVSELRGMLPGLVTKWKALMAADLTALNGKLRSAGLAEIKVEEKPLGRIVGVDVDVFGRKVAGEE
jgi:hypothetical protein